MYLFITALLGKQGWRFLFNTTPWLLRSIRTWRDKWIPSTNDFLPSITGDGRNEGAKVCELMDEDTRNWRRDLVFDLFHGPEAEMICSILISKLGHPDRLVWHYEKNGCYSVRSAYKLLRSGLEGLEETTTSSEAQSWTKLWNAKETMNVEPTCTRCHKSAENIAHALRGYEVTNPLMVEALAEVRALVFAQDMGFRFIELEGDSVGVTNKLNSNETDLPAIGNIIDKGKSACCWFASCQIMHTLRDNNRVAHEIAHFRVGKQNNITWVG
ncbi:hypothetical protein PTKIN_Ptkin05aG0176000 [Pterospermum kingtungense]